MTEIEEGEMPKISIIIPVYNAEKYLHKCLDSVLKQTFTDWEAICINDGSTDGSGQILREFVSKDGRFIVETQENKGVSAARNRGLELAGGKYIMFIDNDDFLHPQAFEIAWQAIEEAQTDFVQFNSQDIEVGDTPRYKTQKVDNLRVIKDYISKFFQRTELFRPGFIRAALWSKIYRASLAKSIKFRKIQPSEDELYNIEFLLKSESCALIDNVLYFYVQNPSSVLHQNSTRKRYPQRLLFADYASDLIVSENIFNDNCNWQNNFRTYVANRLIFKEYVIKAFRFNLPENELMNSFTKADELLDKIHGFSNLSLRARTVMFLIHRELYGLARILVL